MKRSLLILAMACLFLTIVAGAALGEEGKRSSLADELPVDIRISVETPVPEKGPGDVLDIGHRIVPRARVHRPSLPGRDGPEAIGRPTRPQRPFRPRRSMTDGRGIVSPEGEGLRGKGTARPGLSGKHDGPAPSPERALRVLKERAAARRPEIQERPTRPERPRPERLKRSERPLAPGHRPMPDLNKRYRPRRAKGTVESKIRAAEKRHTERPIEARERP